MKECFKFEDCFFEDVCIRLEGYACTCLVCCAYYLERASCHTAVESDFMDFAVCVDFNFNPLGKSINNRSTNAVETARNLITVTAELTAGMENCINYFDSRQACLWLNANRNASAVVRYCDGVVAVDFYFDMVAVAGKRFVDCVVDDFIYEMMEASDRSCTDVHTRTLTDGF